MTISAKRRWWALLALGFFAFMTNLDGSVVNVALPVMAHALKVPASQMVWATSLYLIGVSALLLPFGRLGDLIGKPKIFKWGTAGFVLGSAMASVSFNFWLLMLARLVQAVGASMTLANTYGIVTASFEAKERGRAMGFVGTFVALGSAVGPALGGMVLAAAPWPAIFWLNLPFGLAALVLAFWAMPNAEQTVQGHFDWPGSTLQAAGIAAFFWALNLSQDLGWGSWWVLGLLALALVSGLGFYFLEKRQNQPLLAMAIFRNQIFSLGLLALFCVFVVQLFTSVLMPFYLEDFRHLTAPEAGALLTLYPAAMALAAPAGGLLADRFNPVRVAALAALTVAASSGLYLLLELDSSLWLFAGITSLLGIGSGLFQSPIGDVVMSVVNPSQLGIAGSVNALARNLGMAVGTSMSMALLFAQISRLAGRRTVSLPLAHPSWFMQGLHDTMGIALILALLAAALLVKAAGRWPHALKPAKPAHS